MNEKRCWICGRNNDEVYKTYEEIFIERGIDDKGIVLSELDLWGQKVWICSVCDSIIFKLTHHDEECIDEQDIVLFDDLENLRIRLD